MIKSMIKKGSGPGRQLIGLGLSLLVIGSLVAEAGSQDKAADDNLLRPPRARVNLLSLRWPDLSKLEPGVREHIKSLQDSLAATTKNPAISEVALSEAYGKMGQTYHAYMLISPARNCYLNASSLSPRDFRWVYLLGKLDQEEGHFDEAINRYRVARELRHDYVAVLVNLGNIYLELNRLDEATHNFTAALLIDESDAAAHYGLGQVAMSRRNYAEAVGFFEKALARVPAANRIHYSLAMAYRGLGNTGKARIHLAQQGPVGVRVSDPLFDGLQDLIAGERVHLVRGKQAFDVQRYAEAAAEFRKALVAKPDSVTARLNLGATLTQLGDLEGAAEQFEEVLGIDPKKVDAHYNLAVLLAGQNKHEQAIAHLQSALSVDPNDLNARYLLAQELSKSGRIAEALAEFSFVVHADPNNEQALLQQVRLLQQKGLDKEALDALEKAHAKYPQRGRTLIVLAYVLATSPRFDLRDGARALQLAQLVYQTTGSAQHGALVAMALAELGRCSDAIGWQRRMIAAAEQHGNMDLHAKLSAVLKHYEGPSCRPTGETPLADFLLPEVNR